jgi:hypothetical protein
MPSIREEAGSGVPANDNRGMRRFSGPELAQAPSSLSGWSVVDGKLHKDYGFMATAALAMELDGRSFRMAQHLQSRLAY